MSNPGQPGHHDSDARPDSPQAAGAAARYDAAVRLDL
jgi:hypothetical protein